MTDMGGAQGKLGMRGRMTVKVTRARPTRWQRIKDWFRSLRSNS